MMHGQLDPGDIDRSKMLYSILLVMVMGGWAVEPKVLAEIATEKIDRILQEVLTIKKMIFEGVLSAEFAVFYPPRDCPFNSSHMIVIEGANMKEQHRKKLKVKGLKIAFPVGFGLEYWGPCRQSHSTVVAKVKVVVL